jgi:exodeoxyribonuclease VII small subunit
MGQSAVKRTLPVHIARRPPKPGDCAPLPGLPGSGFAAALSLLPASAMATSSDTPASFEAALAELEEIVATMEDGALPLKASLAAYQRGAVLLQYCQAALKDAEQQVAVLEKGVLKAFEVSGREGAADEP